MTVSNASIPYPIACFLLAMLLALPASAQQGDGEPVGKVVVARGDVTARSGQADPRPLERRSDIHQGETVVTGPNGQTQLRFEDGAVVALDSGSQLVIENYRFEEEDGENHAVVKLLTGGLRTLSGEVAEKNPDNYQVDTPLASIGVRGTDYQLALDKESLNVAVWSGQVVVTNEAGELPLGQNANYRYATVTDRGLPPEGQLEPPAALEQKDVSTDSVDEVDDSEEETGSTTETTETDSDFQETEDEIVFEESDALDTSLESEVEEEAETIEPWIPDNINQKTLGASGALVEVASESDNVFSTNSTSLNPEQAQYVAEAPDGMYISLEGAGLDRFAENVGGYGINWGAWNGQPDLLLHEDEFDEAGTAEEPLTEPLFFASAPAVSLDDIQAARGTNTIQFGPLVAAIGDIRDETLGFDVGFGANGVDLASSSLALDAGTGEVSGNINVAYFAADVQWQADVAGIIDSGSIANLDILALDYSGRNAPNTLGSARGLVVIDNPDTAMGFLSNFHFQTEDGSASTTGILLLEENL